MLMELKDRLKEFEPITNLLLEIFLLLYLLFVTWLALTGQEEL